MGAKGLMHESLIRKMNVKWKILLSEREHKNPKESLQREKNSRGIMRDRRMMIIMQKRMMRGKDEKTREKWEWTSGRWVFLPAADNKYISSLSSFPLLLTLENVISVLPSRIYSMIRILSLLISCSCWWKQVIQYSQQKTHLIRRDELEDDERREKRGLRSGFWIFELMQATCVIIMCQSHDILLFTFPRDNHS